MSTLNFLSIAVVVVLLITPSAKADDAITAELKKFEGTWQLVSATKNGKAIPEENVRKTRVVIKDARHTVIFGGNEVTEEIPFTVNPEASPRSSTDTLPDGRTILGIYRLDGDMLTSCVAEPGKDRPSDFVSKPGSGHTLRAFKRVKP